MAQRILTVTGYLFRSLLLSLAGVSYLLLALVFWRVFFDPTQTTPEPSYYVLVVGLFGAAATFLITLSIASRGYRAVNYPLLARLPSRVEHLTAVLLASLLYALFLQFVIALLATFRGPDLTLAHILDIPPLWLAVDILAAVLALHASDLVTSGWSRVYLYTTLAVFLFGQALEGGASTWLAARLLSTGRWFLRRNLVALSDMTQTVAGWLTGTMGALFDRFFELPFWPFRAMIDAVRSGSFTLTDSLAPAILLLYATILFMLAADLFANKDLFLAE